MATKGGACVIDDGPGMIVAISVVLSFTIYNTVAQAWRSRAVAFPRSALR